MAQAEGYPQSEAVRVEREGAVITVILSRPDVRNAIDGPTAITLCDAFQAFEADDSASVAVLFGAHGTFCAGADLKALSEDPPLRANRMDPPDPRAAEPGHTALGPVGPTRLVLSKPVIAAVAGHAVAGGMELALWCDLRVMEADAVFGVFCRRWGVPLVDGGTIRLPRLIGHARAMDLILTGRPVGAEEALAFGLANRVVPSGEARAAAEALAADIERFPQVCLRRDRLSALEQWDLPLGQALANEYAHGMATLESGETFEGAAKFAGGAGRGGRFDDV